MKQLLVRKGQVLVESVPKPRVSPNNVLVKVHYSCISPGTEMTTVKGSGEPIYKRLIKNPEYISKALNMVKDKGLSNAKTLLKGKIDSAHPIGYSASGEIIEIGENVIDFSVGDHVACAGAGHANHAEIIDVPVNLVIKIPKDLPLDLASTVTLGSIALQGVRRAQPQLGEVVCVFGLGILGQITAQLLKNNGCRVIGIDIDQQRIDQALENGIDHGINSLNEDAVARVHKLTENFGADAVIIAAAASNDSIIDESMRICRKKGRVVLVGSVDLNFSREEFYKKEIDFLISTSYGPGRYDYRYELEGMDYPFPYVRWTENRNMSEYLRLIHTKRISLKSFVDSRFKADEASKVYADLKAGTLRSMLIVLKYSDNSGSQDQNTITVANKASTVNGAIQLALIGAGDFAQSTHLPNLKLLGKKFALRSVMSRTGAKAVGIAKQFGGELAVSSYEEVLDDTDVNLVLISTRHNLHAPMALEALKSGKNVFVEKPLAMNFDELNEIKSFYESAEDAPLLMTGFNRRFSEAAAKVKSIISKSTTPLIINYKMNAGFIPKEVWVHGPEGGGRNIGEACHIYDLFNFWTESKCESVNVDYVSPSNKQWLKNDNFVVSLKYADGSLCTLTYTSMGNKSFQKESCELFFDGQIIQMNNFKEVIHHGTKGAKSYACNGKGHLEELEAIANSLQNNADWPISFDDQISATEISLHVEQQFSQN